MNGSDENPNAYPTLVEAWKLRHLKKYMYGEAFILSKVIALARYFLLSYKLLEY